MKRTILITMALVTMMGACVAMPSETSLTQLSIGAFCNDGLGPIRCWPNSFGQGDSYCASACSSSGWDTGYCQDYTDGDSSFCLNHCVADSSGWHSTDANCASNGLWCYPIFAKHCLAGQRP